jgi:WD40 repeat protein
VVVAGYPDGRVVAWHASSGQCLWQIAAVGDNQVFALDFSPPLPAAAAAAAERLLAVAGSDGAVRLYDVDSRRLVQELVRGLDDVAAGHSSRVFCVRWNPRDPDVLVSGGWDKTVQVWSRTALFAVCSTFRPHITGDALDILLDARRPRHRLHLPPPPPPPSLGA